MLESLIAPETSIGSTTIQTDTHCDGIIQVELNQTELFERASIHTTMKAFSVIALPNIRVIFKTLLGVIADVGNAIG